MKNLFLLIICLLAFVSQSVAQELLWAKNIGGTNVKPKLATDPQGNTYLVGAFSGTADVDPGPATFNLTAVGFHDVFVAKYNVAGGLVWAKAFGGADFDEPVAVALDNAGNVYTTGWFTDSADFDPGAANFNLYTTGGGNMFISKLDASGNFVWARSFGKVTPVSVAVDEPGNVYAAGYFTNTVDFDPGVGVVNLVSAGSADVYVLKLDGMGNLLWAGDMGGVHADHVTDMKVDKLGNVYTIGDFDSTADFDPGPGVQTLIAQGGSFYDHSFISCLDASGNFVWAKYLRVFAGHLAIDRQSNLYISGGFKGTADFDPGPGQSTLSLTSSANLFVLKLDGSGNYQWAQKLDGGFTLNWAIATDDSSNVYFSGLFYYSVDFDPSSAIYQLTDSVGGPVFLCKWNSSGGFAWATHIGLDQGTISSDIVIDSLHNVCWAGYSGGSMDADGGPNVYTLNATAGSLIFLERLAQCSASTITITGSGTLTAPAGYLSYQWYRNNTAINTAVSPTYAPTQPGNYFVIAEDTNGCADHSNTVMITGIGDPGMASNITIYPNPNDGRFLLSLDASAYNKPATVTVTTITGVVVYQKNIESSTNGLLQHVDLTGLGKGMYLVKVSCDRERITKKVMVQ